MNDSMIIRFFFASSKQKTKTHNTKVIVHDVPPTSETASRYREQLWDLYLPIVGVNPARRKKNLKRRFILNFFLNGDLRSSEITHWCSYGCCPDFETTLARFSKLVTWALLPIKPPIFPRSRWTRWDESIDAVALLGGCHSLLSDLYPSASPPDSVPVPDPTSIAEPSSSTATALDSLDDLFADECKSMSMPLETIPLAEPSGPSSSTNQPRTRKNAQRQAAKAKAKVAEAETAKGEHENTDKDKDPDKDKDNCDQEMDQGEEEHQRQSKTFDWAAFNKQQKMLAKDWVQTSPFPRLCVMKELAECLMRLMYVFLRLSGGSWERQHRYYSSKPHHVRSYAVVEAAKGQDVQDCVERLHGLLWVKPPCVSDYSPLLKTLRFRMISTALCSLHSLVRFPRKGFPFKLFTLLIARTDTAKTAQSLLDTPTCLRDELADLILRQYAPLQQHWIGYQIKDSSTMTMTTTTYYSKTQNKTSVLSTQ